MKWLQSALGQRVIGLLLLLLLLAAIVFGGQALHIPRETAYLVALAALFVAVVVFFVAQYRASRSAAQLEQALRAQGLVGGGALRPGQPAVEDLRKQFDESLALLRQSRLGRGAIYKLPWFVLIGPSGSGKTTMLRESGINFPYMTKGRAAIRGIGGTKNCDWWFADRAVLLDTAGRWVSEAEDRDEWLSFLDLLRKSRSRQPINGAIVGISIGDIACSSLPELQKLADDVRDRLDELTRRLQVLFPVYLVFTKCDALLGFVESFRGLGDKPRKQAWGFTLPEKLPENYDFAKTFAAEFDVLQAQLGKRRMQQLVGEPLRNRRRLLFRLPQEFAGLRERLCQFAELIQQANPYQEASAIRGCYFTSGTQERGALGEILSVMASKSGMAAADLEIPPAERKCYFVDDVFERIVFEDGALAKPTRAAGKRRRVLEGVQLVGIGLAALLLAWFAIGRFREVRKLTNEITSVVASASNSTNLADRVRATMKLLALQDKAPVGSDVALAIAKRAEESVGGIVFDPAATAAILGGGDVASVDEAKPGDVLGGLAKLGERRKQLLASFDRTKAALVGEGRVEAHAAALSKRLDETSLETSERVAAKAAFEGVLRENAQDEPFWQRAMDEWRQGEQGRNGQLANLANREAALLTLLQQQNGMVFLPLLEEHLQLQRKPAEIGITTDLLEFTIPGALVARASLPPDKAPDHDLEIVRQSVDDRVAELKKLPLAEGREEERAKLLELAGRDFKERILPAEVQRRWIDVLSGIKLQEGLTTRKVKAEFANIEAASNSLLDCYKKAMGSKAGIEPTFADHFNAFGERMKACSDGGENLTNAFSATKSLCEWVGNGKKDRDDDWSRIRDEAARVAVVKLEDGLFRSLAKVVLRDTVRQLRQKFTELRRSNERFQRLFPWDPSATEEVGLEEFSKYLADLNGVVTAYWGLPNLPVSLEGVVESKLSKFAEFCKDANALVRRFGQKPQDLTIDLHVVTGNSFSSAEWRFGDQVLVFGRDRSKPQSVQTVQLASNVLRITAKTQRGIDITNASLQKKPFGDRQGPSYWNLFRLCFSALPDRNARCPDDMDPKHTKAFVIMFQTADLDLPMTFYIGAKSGDGTEELFAGPECFKLDFPRDFPWNV